MNKKAIFEYCGWCNSCVDDGCKEYDLCEEHWFDGNDTTDAMHKMNEKGDWGKFYYYAYELNRLDLRLHQSEFTFRLMQPARFFELMSEALEKGVIK
jgi:hypothetical protein